MRARSAVVCSRARSLACTRLGPLLAWTLFSAGNARADDDRLVLMREPTPYTDVIDAAESHDRFDLNVHVGYLRTRDLGEIAREHTNDAGERKRSRVADSDHLRSELMLGLDVGIYHDLMAFVRVPLVLSDTRRLKRAEGRSADQVAPLLRDPGDFPGGDGTLFDLPLGSPTRAGFDYVALGGAYAITSQERKAWLPTWVVLMEGRRAIASAMKPCYDAGDAGMLCNAGSEDGVNVLRDGSSGVSRGVSALSLETRVSKRFRYAEPYAGIGVLLEWASTAKKLFTPAGDLEGLTVSAPPRQVFTTLGAEIIPWEHRGRYQRVAIDGRLMATYFTRGLDYSALFDALGSSDHGALARANYEGVRGSSADGELTPCAGGDDSDCYVGEQVPFTGITQVQSHVRYGARLGVDIRAARYVRFALGAGLSWLTAHALTGAAACNGAASAAARGVGSSGQDCGSHASNPAYRGTIDAPGRRFWMDSELLFDLYASATAQF